MVDAAQRKEWLNEWDQKLSTLFDGTAPEQAEWNSPAEIERVLQIIAGANTVVFLPGSGCDDFAQCRLSNDGLLEWSAETDSLDRSASVLRPIKLTFWNPGTQQHDANFILEGGSLAPVYPDVSSIDGGVEEVVELSVGDHAPRSVWDNNEFGGKPLPDTARVLSRNTMPGRYAMFSRGSIYNLFRDSSFDGYRGHHDDPTEFKMIVTTCAMLDL